REARVENSLPTFGGAELHGKLFPGVDGLRVQQLNIQLLDRRQGLRSISAVKHLFQATIANCVENQPMLLAQDLFFLLVGEVRALRLVGVRGGAFADAASANKDLCLQKQVGFTGLALDVVNRVLVLNVSIKAKDHILG